MTWSYIYYILYYSIFIIRCIPQSSNFYYKILTEKIQQKRTNKAFISLIFLFMYLQYKSTANSYALLRFLDNFSQDLHVAHSNFRLVMAYV